MQEHSAIQHSSQVLGDKQTLVLGELAQDLGLKQSFAASKDEVVLSDGRLVKLQGTDEDILLVAQDRNTRVKQALIHLYLSGRNLSVARDTFVDLYGTAAQFWKTMSNLTGYSRAKLENEIKIYQAYTAEEIALLTEAGCTQSLAIKMLKAPAIKAQAVIEAAEGKQINSDLVAELSELEEETEEEEEKTATKTGKSSASLTNKSASNRPLLTAQTAVVDVAASSSKYSDLVENTKDYRPSEASADERLQALLEAVNNARSNYDLTTVRGEIVRREMAMVLAEFYDLTLPSEEKAEGEPEWLQDMRKLSKSGKLSPLQIMAYTDGHLDYRNGCSEPPNYEGLFTSKRLKLKEAADVLYDFWAVGYAQAKAVSEA